MNKILIPTDFADQSFPMIDYGVNLAYSMHLGVRLFFCLDISKFTAPYFHFELNDLPCDLNDYSEVYENVGERCYQYIKRTKKKYGNDFQIDYVAGSGWYANQVLEMVRESGINILLIHGKKKYGFIDRLVQNAESIMIDNAMCHIWVVPPEYDFKCLRKILFITDSEDWDEPVLDKIHIWTTFFGASLEVLNITQEARVGKSSKFSDMSFEFLDEEVSLNRINQYLLEGQFDLLVIVRKENCYLKEVLSKKEFKKLVFKTRLPLLLYQQEDKVADSFREKKCRRIKA